MEDDKPKKKAVRVKIEVDDKLAGGRYSNLILVNHSDSEFVIDFFFLQPQRPAAHHASRMVVSPRSAKRLVKMLNDQIARYERIFGEIQIKPGQTPEMMN